MRQNRAAPAFVAGVALLFLAGCAGGAGTGPATTEPGLSGPVYPRPMLRVAADPAPRPPSPPMLTVERDPLFARCSACHSLRPRLNGIGPSLAGIWGRASGTAPNYRYSEGMAALGVTWDAATLDRWLTDPDAMVPHTRMTFAGMANPLLRASIIAFLQRESRAAGLAEGGLADGATGIAPAQD